jgi:hypothetical protein
VWHILPKQKIASIHDNIVTWRKELEVLKYIIYPRDMSTPSISTTCPAITEESFTSFKASSSLQVATKPSHVVSESARGYRDFKIQRVMLTDCLILARMISRDLVGGLSSIWGVHFGGGLTRVEEGNCIVHHHLQGVKLGI